MLSVRGSAWSGRVRWPRGWSCPDCPLLLALSRLPLSLSVPTGNPRCKRFAIYVDNGTIKHVAVSETADDPTGDGDISASAAKGMIAAI